MQSIILLFLFGVLFVSAASNNNNNNSTSSNPSSTNSSSSINPTNSTAPPDVYLNIPKLKVELIQLDVEKLNVSIDLNLKVANLVTLTAGVNAYIEKVNLTIQGVEAQAELIVRLDNVARIVEDTLQTIDKNPQILTGLIDAIGGLVGEVSGVLSQTVNSLGQTIRTVVDSAGNIIDQTLGSAGQVVSQTISGNLNALQIITSATNALGQYVTRVRNSDGSVYDIIYDKAGGKVISVTVVSPATTKRTELQ